MRTIYIRTVGLMIIFSIQEAEKWPEWYSNSKNVVIHGNDKMLKKDRGSNLG